MSSPQSTTPHRRTRRSPVSAALLLAVVTAAASAFGVIRAADARVADVERIPGLEAVLVDDPKGPATNYLIIGSDSRDGSDPNDPDFDEIGDVGDVSGRRSDTIMVLRQEKDGNGAAIVSFPRDLLVTISDTGRQDRINSAYNRGPEVLAATIIDQFGIPIQHVVDVDFVGFKNLVDAVGGTTLCFEYPTRDTNSGLDQLPGCNRLDGVQALAYARSRNYEEFRDGDWRKDPTADLGRVQRQQGFIKTTVDATLDRLQTDPFLASELIESVSGSLRLDPGLDPIAVASTMRKAFSSGLNTYQLPVSSDTVDGKSILRLNDGADPIFDYFRGTGPLPAVEPG